MSWQFPISKCPQLMTVGMSLHTSPCYMGFPAKDIECYDSAGNHFRGQWAGITKHQDDFVRAQQQKKCTRTR